jgi:cysteinyl-tRNA synthetase
MANYWMHNGFLMVEGEKMAKSLGNFITIRELLETEKFGGRSWPGEVLRLAMLTTSYKDKIDWTVNSLEDAKNNLTNWQRLVANVDRMKSEINPAPNVLAALLDDLNTSEAIQQIHKIAGKAQTSNASRDVLYDSLVFMGLLPDEFELADRGAEKIKAELNLSSRQILMDVPLYKSDIEKEIEAMSTSLPMSANSTTTLTVVSIILFGNNIPIPAIDTWRKYNPSLISSEDRRHIYKVIGIDNLNSRIESRFEARKAKNFKESDRIRDELLAMGVVLKDGKDPQSGEPVTTWEVAR